MKTSKTHWLILLAATAFVCWQTVRPSATSARIKVENNSSIIAGTGHPPYAAAYDPYFIHVNETPHLQAGR